MFSNIKDALYWLENIKRKERRKDLSRIKALAKELDVINPNYKIIHITGTNGKGSTAIYLETILEKLGYKVGLFTSPYIVNFNERIMINDEAIGDSELLLTINNLYNVVKEYESKNDDIVPFFEIVVLIMLVYFKDKNLDYAVIECGLGGLLDATNFLNTDCQVLTSVGFDHMNVLGNTLKEIAYQKAGIMKTNKPFICYYDNEYYEVIKESSIINKANLITLNKEYIKDIKLDLTGTSFLYEDTLIKTPLIGNYQAYNLVLALNALKQFVNIDLKEVTNYLNDLKWPGRFEIINDNLILDGGHNVSAIKELVINLEKLGLTNLCVIFSALKDKRYDLMLKELDRVTSFYIFTTFPDLRSEDPNLFKNYTNKDNVVINYYKEALKYQTNLPKLVVGSLHFISLVRKLYL